MSGRTAYCARLGCCRKLAPYDPPRGLSSSLPRYREVLGYGLEPVTPYPHIALPSSSRAARRGAYISGPERTPAMTTSPTTTTTTRTEYGKLYPDPRFGVIDEVVWEYDGRLFLRGGSESVETSDVDALHAAVERHNDVRGTGRYRRIELFSRVVTETTTTTVDVTETRGLPVVVKPPVKLPTAKASVVKATAHGERSVFYLDIDGDWTRTEGSVGSQAYCRPDDLSDVEVVFDAAGVTL